MDAERWSRAVDAYLLPTLGDGWRNAGGILVFGPVGATAATVQPRPPRRPRRPFQIDAIVWPLVIPVLGSYTCGLLVRQGFREPDLVAGYAAVMPGVRDAVAGEALDFLRRYGSPDGFVTYQQERRAWDAEQGLTAVDVIGCEELAALHAVRGDWDGVLAEAALAERAEVEYPNEYTVRERIRALVALGPDGARAAAARTAGETAAALGLPAPRFD